MLEQFRKADREVQNAKIETEKLVRFMTLVEDHLDNLRRAYGVLDDIDKEGYDEFVLNITIQRVDLEVADESGWENETYENVYNQTLCLDNVQMSSFVRRYLFRLFREYLYSEAKFDEITASPMKTKIKEIDDAFSRLVINLRGDED